MQKTSFAITARLVFIYLFAMMIIIITPQVLNAAMQSSNYIIYETVMHSFDGPIISNVADSVSEQSATITWNTDIDSDSFVIYDTANTFANSKEQGTHSKTFTAHSVVLSGLEANTTYYYRVRSERVNGGITTDTTERTFTTGSEATEPEEETPTTGSGGILIIDKRDKIPPVITDVLVTGINYDSVIVSWTTDEEATGFVEYGETTAYGRTYGNWETSNTHEVTLINLASDSNYHFRVLSSDMSGNAAYSLDQIFTTAVGEGEEAIIEEEEEEKSATPEAVTQSALDFILRLFPSLSLNELAGINSIEELSSLISAPILSGEPVLEITATQATIKWTTDIPANSTVALAPDLVYAPSQAEAYQQIIGNRDEAVVDHEVTLYNLTPDTLYHYQLRSKPELGQMARSRDFTFRTNLEELTITSFFSQIINDQTAIFKWITNKEADTTITFTPFRGNTLSVEESKTISENAFSAIHEMTIEEFVGGIFYNIEIKSIDANGNVAEEIFERFSTSEDDRPPEISYIKADSTVFVDRTDKIQTIISWVTNEPATGKVYYQEGVHGNDVELKESTNLNTNYTKEHVVVITKFKPGVVYSFRVESVDSGNNVTSSKSHTFITAKKRESIIQIILNILENTFGWIKQLM